MFKGMIVPGAYTSGVVPISQMFNTNDVYALNADQVRVKQGGITDVKVNIIFKASSTGDVTCQLYANNTVVSGAAATVTVVSGGTYTLQISDAVLVQLSPIDPCVNLTVQLSKKCSIISGDIITEHRD